jgi:CxxC motif-containing protein (DUF1111 family)
MKAKEQNVSVGDLKKGFQRVILYIDILLNNMGNGVSSKKERNHP